MIFDFTKRRTSLRFRLLFWVWLVTSVTTFVFTTFQLYSDYSYEKNLAVSQLQVIRKNYIPSINKSLWDFNFNYLELQIMALKNLPYVKHVEVKSSEYNSKDATSHDLLEMHSIPLSFNQKKIGTLEIGIDIEGIQKAFITKSIFIFLIQGLKTLIVCFLLLKIFEIILVRHVLEISGFMKTFNLNDDKFLKLDRTQTINDELSLLVDSINELKKELIVTSNDLVALNKDLEEKVKERTRLLEEERGRSIHAAKLASLGEMAGGIAHEINNPLAIISSTAHFLKKRANKGNLSQEDLFESIQTIESTVLRTSKIIAGLRTVSRQSEGLELEKVQLRDMLDDILGLCSARFKNHGVSLSVPTSDAELNHKLYCDRVQLSQVLINLLGNAFDAIQSLDEKWIVLELGREKNFDQLVITDSGRGIDPLIVEKMFNPFFTSKEVGKGTGLGLSISKSIMEKHKGMIEVDSAHPNTRFVIKLPAA